MSTRTLSSIAAIALATLSLVACSGPASDEAQPQTTTPAESSGFPRTIEVPAGTVTEAGSLTLDAEPLKIAALDYESAEVIAEIGLGDRLVLVPEAVMNPALGSHIEEMEQVPNTIPVAMDLSAETVIAAEPDLVVMSPRHGAETKIGSVLVESGIPTLQLPESWTSVASTTANIDLIGEATGADSAADDLAAELDEGLSATEPASDGPRVLVLTNQSGRAFITAGDAYPLELLSSAGGQSVSDALGITKTGTISAEQVVEADPDGILLIDMNGSGNRMFSELLGNEAVAALPGAQRTLLLEGRDVQALGLTNTITGLHELQEWITELQE